MAKSIGNDLLEIAIHELGHSLGLSHSDVEGSIMYAYYNGYRPDVQLHPDDIAGIQYIYGRCETVSEQLALMLQLNQSNLSNRRGGLVVSSKFEPHSSRHVGTLGMSFTHSCLYNVMWRPAWLPCD